MSIKISPTALSQFLSGCPGKLPFYRDYKMAERYTPAHLRFGSEVHKLLETGLPDDIMKYNGNVLAAEVARKMIMILEKKGYEILAREVWHHAPLTDNIEVVGKIDIVARDADGVPVLVDAKTGGRQWKPLTTENGELIVPKAQTFQAPMYLTPPYEDQWFGGEWPERLDYLMVPNDGATKIHTFYENTEVRENLIQACEMFAAASDNDAFPLNRGWLCERCDWEKICYKIEGWEKYYEKR